MNFDTPLPWTEALDALEAKGLLPTHLSSRAMREEFGTDLMQRSILSARTTKASLLEDYRGWFAKLLGGETNIATARYEMQRALDALDYDATKGGFPGEEVEPAESGSIRDLRSDARIDLVLQTNTRQVANFAFQQSGMSDSALYWFPAWELIRIYRREVPRGLKRTKGGALTEDPGQDWPSRWEQVGGNFYDGRMIALKDDPIWSAIGSSGNFDDGLDASFPPFAFNSGFAWREVSRADCEQLGIPLEGEKVTPAAARMNEGLQVAAQNFSTEELKAISAGLKTEVAAGKIRLKEAGYDLATRRYLP